MRYINTEEASLSRAKELLASALPGAPIFVRWYRSYQAGNTGTPFGVIKEYCTCELLGVSAKRLKVRDLSGAIRFADPKFCFFASKVVK